MANFNFNKVILGGRLTVDPELKTTPSGVSVTAFSIAVTRSRPKGAEPVTDFFNVVAWRQTAEFITRYFRKGSSICVMGMIQIRQWTDQNGQKRVGAEIVADEAYFVDSKTDAPVYAPAPAAEKPQAGVYATVTSAELEELADDEALPF